MGGWNTISELEHKRLCLIARVHHGRGTLREIWEDPVKGANVECGGFLGWLREAHETLCGSPTPDWRTDDLQEPVDRGMGLGGQTGCTTPPLDAYHWEALRGVEAVIYTDGSKAPNGLVGAEIVEGTTSWHKTLSADDTVYEGEVEAIAGAIGLSKGRTDCQ